MTTRGFDTTLDRLISRTIRGESTGRDAFNQPIPGPEVTATTWAGRRDFTARDQSFAGPGGPITLEDTRYYVRGEIGPWKVGDTFQDNGDTYRVRGIAGVRGGRLLELLVRRVGV